MNPTFQLINELACLVDMLEQQNMNIRNSIGILEAQSLTPIAAKQSDQEMQSIQAFCQCMLDGNNKMINKIASNYAAIARILTNVEGIIVGTTTGQHERMSKLYMFWEQSYTEFLIKYILT